MIYIGLVMFSGRLVLAIISTILEEAALAVIVLVGLPQLNINIPVAVLALMMVVWAVIAVAIYQVGSRALRRKPAAGLEAMVGSRGKVVKPLNPEGMVRIKGELWQAKSDGHQIEVGGEVVVIGREGSRLIVHPIDVL
jgi:membrane-bound ClpP family serine protease